MTDWKTGAAARSKAYADKMKDPRWQKMRLQVLERDGWKCQICDDEEETLHVHHHYYKSGAEPWDYPLTALVTLCATCHEAEREMAREYEPLLIETLHKAGFFADDFRELASAFSSMPRIPFPGVMAQALVCVSHNPDFWLGLQQLLPMRSGEINYRSRRVFANIEELQGKEG